MRNEPLETALKEIASQTELNFIYSKREIDSIRVDCRFSNTPVTAALDTLLLGTPLTFKQTRPGHIVIYVEEHDGKAGVFGIVIDAKTREPLPNSNVWVRSLDTETTTDDQGRFSLDGTLPPPFTLEVTHLGYFTEKRIVRQAASQTVRIALQQNPILMQTVTVHADRPETFDVSSAGVVSVSPQGLTDLPAVGLPDISRSLSLLPGINITSNGAAGLTIRGGMPSQNLVLLDGMTLYHQSHSFGFFNPFSAGALQDVQIYRGNVPARFGGRLSGVVDMTSGPSDFHKTSASLNITPMSAQARLDLPLPGNSAVLLSGRRSFSKYILSSLYDRVFRRRFTYVAPTQFDQSIVSYLPASNPSHEIDFYDVLGKVILVPSASDIVSFTYYNGFDHVESVEDYVVEDTLRPSRRDDFYRQRSNWRNSGFSLSWSRLWNDRFYSTALLSSSDYSRKHYLFQDRLELVEDGLSIVIPGEEYDANNDIKELNLRLENQWTIDKRNKLDIGLSLTRPKLRFETVDYDQTGTADKSISESDNTARLLSAYAEHTWNPVHNMNLSSGLRINRYQPLDAPVDSGSQTDWEPRLALTYRLYDIFMLKGAWNRLHQYIMQFGDDLPVVYARDSFTWVLSDLNELQPGRSENVVFGFRLGHPDFMLDAEFYRRNMKNIFENFDARQFEKTGQELNQYPGRATGLDVLLKKKTGFFTGWMSYGWSRSRIEFDLNGETHHLPNMQDTPHQIKLACIASPGPWRLSASWQHLSGRPYSIPSALSTGGSRYFLLAPALRNTERLPDTHRLDFSVAYTFSTSFLRGKAGVSIYNLYNQQNVWYRYFIVRNGEVEPVDVYEFDITPTFFFELEI